MTAHTEIHDDPLEFLREADPVAQVPLTAGVDRALGELAQAVVGQPYATRRIVTGCRRVFRPRIKVALVIGIVALIVGGVATAAVALHAYTGIFPSGPNASVGGPGEELNLAAPDFASVALKLSADIPYPAGYAPWREFVLTEQLPGPGGAAAGDQVTTGAVRGTFAASAFCAWVQDWRQAIHNGNSAEANQATTTIAAAPSWSAVTAEDPHPSAGAPNDPGAQPGTLFGWMLPYRSAVLAGNANGVDQMLASGYGDGKCWLADPQWMNELQAHSAWSKLSPQALAQRYEQFLARGRS
jgi:hypothetical protein